MKDLFVPYKLAVKLKKLGFNEECFGYYEKDSKFLVIHYSNRDLIGDERDHPELYHLEIKNNNISQYIISSPLINQVFKWVREKYQISYSIDWITRNKEYYSGYIVDFRGINGKKINQENFIVLNDELPLKGYGVYKTYEEAELACLNKLIEMVKKEKENEN